jgi:glycosyltransferase XagB
MPDALNVLDRPRPRHRPLGALLVDAGVITGDQLQDALRVHDDAELGFGQALVNLGFVAEDDVMEALGRQSGLPFVDLDPESVDPAIARLLPEQLERATGTLPLYRANGTIVVGCTDLPDRCGFAEIAAQLDGRAVPVLIAGSAFDAALHHLYRDEYLDESSSRLARQAPADSASLILTRAQQVSFVVLCAVVAFGFVQEPMLTLTLLAGISTLFYTVFSVYKLRLVHLSLSGTREAPVSAAEIAALDDRDLPIYTILVPVYREAEVLPILARAIDQLDYPKSKLDVRILLEEDDTETIQAARDANLPSHIRPVIVPSGKPRGKPRACNYGLIHARGEHVVIFDAEDIPEPDQLKKAVVTFRKGGERLACVQAKLNYFNADQNLLTRWFTAEYSTWFDLFLPGLAASNAPIPLGGTSNHFRAESLRTLGAWDPYNVTEDADLGIRLFKAGYSTAVIDSTTYEEANSEVYNWIRQRSRWIKGYIVTYLVHMRHPVRLWRSMGTRSFWSMQFFVGGTPLVLLLNPIFWVLTVLWFLTQANVIEEMFPTSIFYVGSAALYFGNFTFAYMNVLGCLRRQQYGAIRYALLSPIYWALMSIAAWKGFLQLFYAPSYWEKTKHGLYKASGAEIAMFGGPVGGSDDGVPDQVESQRQASRALVEERR